MRKRGNGGGARGPTVIQSSSSYSLLPGLELSDTHVYEPSTRALLDCGSIPDGG